MNIYEGLLFMQGHIASVELAKQLADEGLRSPVFDPDPNGPVTVRSPGRWPGTARSAAPASEAGATTSTLERSDV